LLEQTQRITERLAENMGCSPHLWSTGSNIAGINLWLGYSLSDEQMKPDETRHFGVGA
jgi:hypothetical protein